MPENRSATPSDASELIAWPGAGQGHSGTEWRLATRDPRFVAALITVVLVSTLVMIVYHNRFWAPADEGNYAHIAQRLLTGQTLHSDIQDVHAGYVHFVNAAAFSVFGLRLVSLRYPLAAITILQSGLLFMLLVHQGRGRAAIGALTLTSLSFIQFLNPTANWYCLFLTICTIAWLWWVPRQSPLREIGTGVLVGATFFFRQLSGVFLGIGVLVFLVLEGRDRTISSNHRLSYILLTLLGLGITGYLLHLTDVLGWVLIGVWPLAVLGVAYWCTAVTTRGLTISSFRLLVGAGISSIPLLIYHALHGSFRAWIEDTFIAAVSLPSLPFMSRPGFAMIGILAWQGLQSENMAARLNGAFWLGMLGVTAVLGLLVIRTLLQAPPGSKIHPLPVIAVFYALVSLHYQLPIYLFYTAGLALGGMLLLTAEARPSIRVSSLGVAAFFSVVGVYYQAGMPLSRNLQGIVAGQRRFPEARFASPLAGLYVDSADSALYDRLIKLTQQETRKSDTIFALPSNAELYFLTGRANPFKFYNTALGIRSPAQLDSVLGTLACHPPKLVFYDPHDKYNTPASARIAKLIADRYEKLNPIPPFEVFRAPSIPTSVTESGCKVWQGPRG